jgi:hypothetical protein
MARHPSWLLAALTLALFLVAPGRAEEPQNKQQSKNKQGQQNKLGTIKSIDDDGVMTVEYNDEKPEWKLMSPAGAKWKLSIEKTECSLDDLRAALANLKPRTVKFSDVKNLGSNRASVVTIEAFLAK